MRWRRRSPAVRRHGARSERRLDSVTHRSASRWNRPRATPWTASRAARAARHHRQRASRICYDLTSQVTTLSDVLANKQVARRLRPGADGGDRPETACRRALTSSSYPLDRKRRIAWCSCPTSARSASTRKFPLEAMTALHDARSDEEGKSQASGCAADVIEACQRHRRQISHCTARPGHRADVRALEIGLCRIHDSFDDVIQKPIARASYWYRRRC